MSQMEPFAVSLAFDQGTIRPATRVTRRCLKDLGAMFLDLAATEARLAENPLLYEVHEINVPEEAGQLLSGISIVYPGKIGDEYFMTKGHYHLRENSAEIYLSLRGEGYLLMQTKTGDSQALRMTPGTAAYVPPYWGHRTINTGLDPMAFYFVYPADAGHDYASIEQEGFARLLVERNGQPTWIDNPRFRKR